MKSIFGMCYNWKVLAGLAAVAVGLFVVAPGLVLGALPLLFLAACPLSMLLMMRMGGHGQGQAHDQTADTLPRVANPETTLEQRIMALAEEQRRLESELQRRQDAPEPVGGRDAHPTRTSSNSHQSKVV
jgi:Protein of unknown function (DUF2933)